jgi:hypothetical protein
MLAPRPSPVIPVRFQRVARRVASPASVFPSGQLVFFVAAQFGLGFY